MMRAAAKQPQTIRHHPSALLLAVGFSIAAVFTAVPQHASADAVGVTTRFDYVAKFPVGTTPAQIEAWRGQVLGQPHKQACMGGRPCVARMMRLALAGSGGREVIAFDLMPDVSQVERIAIAAAAVTELSGTALFVGARPADVDSNQIH